MAYNPDLVGYKALLSDLKAEVPLDNRTFVLLGGTVINDIVTGLFRYEDSSLATPDDVDVVKPDAILLANPGRYIRQKLAGATIGRALIYNDSSIPFTAGVDLALPLNTNQSISTFISHDPVTNNSRIMANKDGIMELYVSPQVLKGGAGAGTLFFWLKKNGTTVAASGYEIGSSNNDKKLPFFTVSGEVAAGDYFEIFGRSTSANFSLSATAAAGTVPLVPSIIITAVLYNKYPN